MRHNNPKSSDTPVTTSKICISLENNIIICKRICRCCLFVFGRSRFRFPMVSLEFFIDIILLGRTMALRLTQPLTEMSNRDISWGVGRPVRRADNLTTLKCRLPWNLGASPSWNPQGLSRPVMGLLYLLIYG